MKILKYKKKIRKQVKKSSLQQKQVNQHQRKYKHVRPIVRADHLDFSPFKDVPKIILHDEYYLYLAHKRCPRSKSVSHNMAPLCYECRGNYKPKCGWSPKKDICLKEYLEDQKIKSDLAREQWSEMKLSVFQDK